MQDAVAMVLQHVASYCLPREHLVGKWVPSSTSCSDNAGYTACFDVITFLENTLWPHARGVELVSNIVSEHCKLHRELRGSDATFVSFVGLSLCTNLWRSFDVPSSIHQVLFAPTSSVGRVALGPAAADRQGHLVHACRDIHALSQRLSACTANMQWSMPVGLVCPVPTPLPTGTQQDAALQLTVGQPWALVGQQLARATASIIFGGTLGCERPSLATFRCFVSVRSRVLTTAAAQVFRGVAVLEEPGAPQWHLPCRGAPLEKDLRVLRAVLLREWGDDLTCEPVGSFFADDDDEVADNGVDLIVVQCSVARAHLAAVEGRRRPTVLLANVGQESMYRLAMATGHIPNACGRPCYGNRTLRRVPDSVPLALRLSHLGCDRLHAESKHSSRAHKVAQIFFRNDVQHPSPAACKKMSAWATVLLCSTTTVSVAAIETAFWDSLSELMLRAEASAVVPGGGLVECSWILQCQQLPLPESEGITGTGRVASRALADSLRQYLLLMLHHSGYSAHEGEEELQRVLFALQEELPTLPHEHLQPKDRLFEILVPRPPLANATAADANDRVEADSVLLSDVCAWDVPSHRIADLRAAIDLCSVLCASRVLAFTATDGVCLF
jgi:hypothetical protein